MKISRFSIIVLSILMSVIGMPAISEAAGQVYDIVVYGGSCSGVTAAIQAKRMGRSVVLLCPEEHIGGLTISGLGWTDTKDVNAIGGLAREFYHRIWQYYTDPAKWVYLQRSSYTSYVSQSGLCIQDDNQTMWTFEPHVAELIYQQWLEQEGVTVITNCWLDRSPGGVVRSGDRITAIKTLTYNTENGFVPADTFVGKMFIDTSYEGDLMAAAGAAYRRGRDSNSEYNETLNGVYFKSTDLSPSKSPYYGIDPYVDPGNPESGFIDGVEAEFDDFNSIGKGDNRLQAFNLRMCLTDVASNKLTISKPVGYDEAQYELLLRLFEAGQKPGFTSQRMPNLKTDSNNSGLMSLDWPGGNFIAAHNWVYSEASYTERMNFNKRQQDYVHGLLWTMQNHPRVPQSIRTERSKWGLAKDEFTDNDHWPYFVYVREARRLEGEMVMTEHHVKMADGYVVSDSIGQGSYSLDSHVVRRVVIDGTIWDEGGFYLWWSTSYPISYRSIVPRRGQLSNLLVPVCLSASHAAFGSIRMEPTYMILGQSAATAASLAIEYDQDVQDVSYDILRTRLLQDGQRLKESFSSRYPAILLNFGATVNNDSNSPAHAIGKVIGNSWNLVTGDVASGLVASDSSPTNISVDLGKTQPQTKVIDWDRHGFINSSLGSAVNSGIYSGNARSATYVDDPAGSGVALGVRISGLAPAVYSLYSTTINTNTSSSDSYAIYAFAAQAGTVDTDFSGYSPTVMANTRTTGSWLFDKNFKLCTISVNQGSDLILVVEGLSDAGYRGFINTLEVVRVSDSPLSPVIIDEPQNTGVYYSDDPDFVGPGMLSCRFRSALEPAVQWYKYVDGINDLIQNPSSISGPDYDEGSGCYLTTLAFVDVSDSVQGDYYCKVSNDESSIVSDTARVRINKTLAHWTLDSDDMVGGLYQDMSGNDHNATISGTPDFIAGVNGLPSTGIVLNSVNGSAVAGNWDPSADSNSFSLAVWVKWLSGGTQTSIIADKGLGWSSELMRWTLAINPSTNKINFVSAADSSFQTSISQTEFEAGQWHHILVTHDGSGNQARLYIDAELANSGSLVLGNKTDSPLYLGSDSSGRYFNGSLDDIRIYNRVLTQKEILNVYNVLALEKKQVCAFDSGAGQFDISGPDGQSDCVVDVYDLMLLSAHWLESGKVQP